jgi:K+-sensing histidine kinase KdpD
VLVALALVVATAAVISRTAGLITAAAASLAFSFFHTEPYGGFTIHSAGDAAIVAVLALLGFVAGDVSRWWRQQKAQARLHA